MITDIGPLPRSDSKFMRRIRIHQAWYRSSVLGMSSYGRLAGSNRPCGSVLSADAAERYMNFHSAEAIRRYELRRQQGWGVDPVRCKQYLTSSQTLTFNMLAPALVHPTTCATLFNKLLGRSDLVNLESSNFEFCSVGTPYSIGDRTLVDLLMRFKTQDGSLQVVAVETKLADRFSTRRTAGMSGVGYRDLASTRNVWISLSDALADNRTRQLTRCHAIAEAVQHHDDHTSSRPALLLVLTHSQDHAANVSIAGYRRSLVEGHSVINQTWDRYLAIALETGALDCESTRTLNLRYADLAPSEETVEEIRSSWARDCPSGE